MFNEISVARKQYGWIFLVVIFDFVFYLFVQLATAPRNLDGHPDIVIHREAIAFGILTSFVSLFTVQFVKKRLHRPQPSILIKYIKMLVLSLLLYAAIVAVVMFTTETLLGQQRNIGYVVGNGIILIFHHFIVGNAFIAYLYLKESGKLREELIVAEKTKAVLELKALQQQMSPHFLFNNLNTLSSLIDPGQEEAIHFSNNLANIYRYFTKNAGEDLVTLKQEISFIEAYFDLMTQRLGTAYQFKIKSEDNAHTNQWLVPMSLQLVVENVLKHNSGDRQNPLIIKMEVTQEKIIVTNELRPKGSPAHHTESGTGLKNLDERCRLVTGRSIQFYHQGTNFVVELPLLNQIDDESTDH